MKKYYLLLMIPLVFASFTIQAQKKTKISIKEGNLLFLKNVSELGFTFDYDGLKVDKKTEKAYVDEEVASKNKEKAGSGDEWIAEWEGYKETIYEKNLIDDFNKETAAIKLQATTSDETEYLAKVKAIEFYPGFVAGPFSKVAWVKLEITFIERKSGKELAKILIDKAYGSPYEILALYVVGPRIGSAYDEAGEALGKLIVKTLKKAK